MKAGPNVTTQMDGRWLHALRRSLCAQAAGLYSLRWGLAQRQIIGRLLPSCQSLPGTGLDRKISTAFGFVVGRVLWYTTKPPKYHVKSLRFVTHCTVLSSTLNSL